MRKIALAFMLLSIMLFTSTIVSASGNHPQAGNRCEVNWGDGHTFISPDNGCVYNGSSRLGGIPEGWYANTQWGDIGPGEVFEVSAITLRPLDGHQVASIGPPPGPQFSFVRPPGPTQEPAAVQPVQPTAAPQVPPAVIVQCPSDSSAMARLLGVPEGDLSKVSGSFNRVGGEPCAWVYNAVQSGTVLEFTVPTGWSADSPSGMGQGVGTRIRGVVFTIRNQSGGTTTTTTTVVTQPTTIPVVVVTPTAVPPNTISGCPVTREQVAALIGGPAGFWVLDDPGKWEYGHDGVDAPTVTLRAPNFGRLDAKSGQFRNGQTTVDDEATFWCFAN